MNEIAHAAAPLAEIVAVCAWCMQSTPEGERPQGPHVSHGCCVSHAALVRIANHMPLPKSPVATWVEAYTAAHDACVLGKPGALAQARAAETLRPKYVGPGGSASVLNDGSVAMEGRWYETDVPLLAGWLEKVFEATT